MGRLTLSLGSSAGGRYDDGVRAGPQLGQPDGERADAVATRLYDELERHDLISRGEQPDRRAVPHCIAAATGMGEFVSIDLVTITDRPDGPDIRRHGAASHDPEHGRQNNPSHVTPPEHPRFGPVGQGCSPAGHCCAAHHVI